MLRSAAFRSVYIGSCLLTLVGALREAPVESVSALVLRMDALRRRFSRAVRERPLPDRRAAESRKNINESRNRRKAG